MSRIIFTFLIYANSLFLMGQKVELFGGAGNNMFHDFNYREGHFVSSYQSGMSYCVGIGIDRVKLERLKLRFTLQFDHYIGELDASDGGLGGGFTTVAKVKKSIISFGLFPINFQFFKKIDFNVGFAFSRLIDESFSGTSSGWLMNQPNWSDNLQDKYSQYSEKMYFGLQARIAYDFQLSESMCISPQYLCYIGLSSEFAEFPTQTKSLRNYFCIGVKKSL